MIFYFAIMRSVNILLIAIVSSKEINKYNEVQKHLRSIEYDPMDRPNINGSALNVTVQFLLYSIRNINKKSFTYNLAVATRLLWVDERLTDLKILQPIMYVPSGILWRPHFEFYK